MFLLLRHQPGQGIRRVPVRIVAGAVIPPCRPRVSVFGGVRLRVTRVRRLRKQAQPKQAHPGEPASSSPATDPFIETR
jgi:hypothetical protein